MLTGFFEFHPNHVILGLRVVVTLQTKMYTYQEFYQKFLAVSITFSGSRLRQKVCLVEHCYNWIINLFAWSASLLQISKFRDLVVKNLGDLQLLAMVFAHSWMTFDGIFILGFSVLSKWPEFLFCDEGRKHELRDKEKAHELYLHAKSEVESCIAYLKEKRKGDPYRNLFPRLFYQATHGFTTEVPTFDLWLFLALKERILC